MTLMRVSVGLEADRTDTTGSETECPLQVPRDKDVQSVDAPDSRGGFLPHLGCFPGPERQRSQIVSMLPWGYSIRCVFTPAGMPPSIQGKSSFQPEETMHSGS